MTHEWKEGMEAECNRGVVTILKVHGDIAFVTLTDDPRTAFTRQVDVLRPIPKPPKLPVGEIYIHQDPDSDSWVAMQYNTSGNPLTIDLRKYHLMQALIEQIEDGQIFCDGEGDWQTSDGRNRGPAWQSAVLDLLPDLAEALGEETP